MQSYGPQNLVSTSYPGAHWGWDSLSHIFHVGTNVRLAAGAALPRDDSSAAYIEHCKLIDPDEPAVVPALDGEVFALPAPDVEGFKKLSLWDALLARKPRASSPASR